MNQDQSNTNPLKDYNYSNKTELLESINIINTNVLESDTSEKLGLTCLQEINKLTKSSHSFIAETNIWNTLDIIAITDIDKTFSSIEDSNIEIALKGLEIKGCLKTIIEKGEAYLCNPPSKCSECINIFKVNNEFKSFLGIPIKENDTVTGLIAVINKNTPFTEENLKALEILSDTFQKAIKHKRKFKDLEKQNIELLEINKSIIESNSKLHNISDNIIDALIMLDDQAKISYWNNAAEIMFGISLEKTIGQDIYSTIIQKEHKDIVKKELDKFLSKDLEDTINGVLELPVIRNDGTSFFVELSLTSIIIEDKKIIVGVARDKAIQKATDQLFNLTTDLAPFAIINTDSTGKIINTNHFTSKLTGYNHDSLLNKSIYDITPEITKDIWPYIWNETKKEHSKEMETSFIKEDKTTFPTKTLISYIKSKYNDHCMFFITDLTEYKNLEEELEDVRKNFERRMSERTKLLQESIKKLVTINEELEEANKYKGQFISSLSHELRTPLNSIIGFSELLAKEYFGKLNEKQLDYVKSIEESGQHLLEVINILIDMAKIDAEQAKPEFETFSSHQIVKDVLKSYEPQFNSKSLTISTSLDKTIDEINSDPKRFKQIFSNLISNAIKYTNNNGNINITLNKDLGDTIKVSIKDDGIGISQNKLEMIFEDFYQIKRESKGYLEGLGIGLSYTRRLIRLLEGDIFVESEENKGSTFAFSLPAKIKKAKSISFDLTQEQLIKIPRNKKILIVEDNASKLQYLIDLLSMYEHQVFEAKNGKEAIEVAMAAKPELIIMDVIMPVMNGVEATRILRAIPEFKNLPIVAMSASIDKDTIQDYINSGYTAHITKPIKSKDIFSALSDHLQK